MGRELSLIKNWPDPHVRRQLINHIVVDEYSKYRRNRSLPWTRIVKERLSYFGIQLEESSIIAIRTSIKNGSRVVDMPSWFGKEIRPRTGKDGMYKQLESACGFFLERKDYIGLPFNQLLYMIQKYDSVVACENKRESFEYMQNMKSLFAPRSSAEIYHGNIFNYLDETDKKFSVYDLDLMQHLYTSSIERIADSVVATSQDISVLCVASCVGRSRKYSAYRRDMPSYLIECLEGGGFSVLHNYSGDYYDRITPMRYEILVIKCRKGI